MMGVSKTLVLVITVFACAVFMSAVLGNRIDTNIEAIAELSTHVETPHLTETDLPDMTAYDTRMDTIEKHQLAILAVLDIASRNDETLDKRDQEFLAIILIIQKELIEQRALIEKLSDTTPSYVEKN